MTASNSCNDQVPEELMIVSGRETTVPGLDSGVVDVLAVSLPAMAALESEQINFLALEDFHSHEKCYSDTEMFSVAVDKWLNDCDQICYEHLGLSRAFSANGFWLLHRLSDLRYLHGVLDGISKRYKKIVILVPTTVPCLSDPEVNFANLNLSTFGFGLGHVLQFFMLGMPEMTVHRTDVNVWATLQELGGQLQQIIRRAPEILWRRGYRLASNCYLRAHKKKAVVWVVQGGYDVEILRRACPDVNFKHVLLREVKAANLCVAVETDLALKEIRDLSESFFSEWLPRYKIWLKQFITTYFRSVVCRLQPVNSGIALRMAAERPLAILYALGAGNILEETIGHVANQQKIPVYYFKHGGAENFFLQPSVLDKYFEQNFAVARTQFLHSNIELSHYNNLSNVRTVVTGALERPLFRPKKKRGGEILYSVGPPAHFSFKEMRKTISDCERYQLAKSLIDVCLDQTISLDIKVHPGERKVGTAFFETLLASPKRSSHRIRLITGGTTERILDQYSLLVLDMISTRVLSGVLNLDLPVIMFIPYGFPVKSEYYLDLQKRIHVVHNKEELGYVLTRHSKGELPSLFSKDFSRKYLAPMSAVDSLKLVRNQIFPTGN